MRRTLTVLVASAALLVPATAASAAQPADRVKTNASCSNGKGGNDNFNPDSYNLKGNTTKAAGCLGGATPPKVTPPVKEEPVEETPIEETPEDTGTWN